MYRIVTRGLSDPLMARPACRDAVLDRRDNGSDRGTMASHAVECGVLLGMGAHKVTRGVASGRITVGEIPCARMNYTVVVRLKSEVASRVRAIAGRRWSRGAMAHETR